jgi:ribonuclease HII
MIIIGCDEAGLGSISGPVVTAAVVLPADKTFEGLRDSKKMTASDREWLAVKIKEQALGWVIAGATARQIDRHGISACRWFCMGMCANECLKRYPDGKVIVDGNQLIAGIPRIYQEAVVKADDKFQAVSAASVIAKVHRDGVMVKLWQRYPQYDWKKNMGYPTRDHLAALRKYGVSPHHRRSYGPVKKQLEKEKGR